MIGTVTLSKPFFQELTEEHRSWLSAYGPQHLAKWELLLNGNVEAACCESAVRRRLQDSGIIVEPNENLRSDGSGPDFRCKASSSVFYTEVTCVLCSTATARTGILEEPGCGPTDAFGMTEAIFNECVNKAKQCRDMDAPTLVAVGTFHGFAALTCFSNVIVSSVLTGKTKIAWNIDETTGRQVGETYQMTELEMAAFLKPDRHQGVGFARCSVSGVVLHGLGGQRCLGVLHPNPVRPFDPAMLPDIEFGRVELDRSTRRLRVHWPNGGDD